jgi:hypothetical protein
MAVFWRGRQLGFLVKFDNQNLFCGLIGTDHGQAEIVPVEKLTRSRDADKLDHAGRCCV